MYVYRCNNTMYSMHTFVFQIDDLHETVDHNHEPKMVAFEATQARVVMQKRVQQVGAQPGQVMASELHEAKTETRAALGRIDTVKRALRRYKNRNWCCSRSY